jgi:hypothetical protein
LIDDHQGETHRETVQEIDQDTIRENAQDTAPEIDQEITDQKTTDRGTEQGTSQEIVLVTEGLMTRRRDLRVLSAILMDMTHRVAHSRLLKSPLVAPAAGEARSLNAEVETRTTSMTAKTVHQTASVTCSTTETSVLSFLNRVDTEESLLGTMMTTQGQSPLVLAHPVGTRSTENAERQRSEQATVFFPVFSKHARTRRILF